MVCCGLHTGFFFLNIGKALVDMLLYFGLLCLKMLRLVGLLCGK